MCEPRVVAGTLAYHIVVQLLLWLLLHVSRLTSGRKEYALCEIIYAYSIKNEEHADVFPT